MFRRRDFFVGDQGSLGLADVMWLRPDGEEMTDEDWERHDAHALGVFLNGEEIPNHDREGNPIEGASFLMLFNAHHEPLGFEIAPVLGSAWTTVLCTDPDCEDGRTHQAGERVELSPRSLRILRRRRR